MSNVKIHKIAPATATDVIIPTLIIQVEIEYYWSLQFPLTVSGDLRIGNKCVALLHENVPLHSISHEDMPIKKVPNTKDRWSTTKITNYFTTLSAELSPSAVDWIEICREKSFNKSVSFDCNFLVKFLYNSGHNFIKNEYHEIVSDSGQRSRKDYNHEIVSMKRETSSVREEIEQSRWVREFAPALGIGKFFLVEQKQEERLNIPDWWKQVHGNMTINLQDIERHLKACEWQEVMEDARKFYENAKIGDEKGIYADFKLKFDQYLNRDNHTEEGRKNFYDGIWQFFEFISKYVHNRDRNGNPVAKVIARKEDAYFAYSLALGLFNLITQKVETR